MTAEEWMRDRLPGAPADLLRVMADAVAPFAELPCPEALAKGASELYSRVIEGAGGREDALPLLAADALLTHAFQAQAELDPDSLEKMAADWTSTELVKQE